MKAGDTLVVEARDLDALLGALRERGHTLLGPTVRDGAIVIAEIGGAADLPVGWIDQQEGGRYRLGRRDDAAFFGYAVGPQSWKKYLHPAQVKLLEADQKDGLFRILDSPASPARPYAFVGVRACELAAIAIQTMLTGRLLNKIGLKNVFIIFPMILLAGISWILVFPTNLISVISGLALPKLGRSTIDEPARKSFQALVPPERRGRVSMFMDSYLFAVGAIVGSLILGTVILLKSQFGSLRAYDIYLGIGAAATAVTIWFAFQMRGVYDASLLNWRLKRRQRASGVLDKLDF